MICVADDRSQRDRNDDAQDPEETAEKNDGDQDPDRGNAEGVPEQLGLEDIAVHSLKDQRKEKEPQSVPGLNQNKYKCSYQCSDDRSKGRCQIGDADDH